MATLPDSVFQSLDNGNSPLELLMFGFTREEAGRCSSALRNSGQAVRMECADTRDGLVRLLETEPADLVAIQFEAESELIETVIELVREANPSAAVMLLSPQPDVHLDFAIRHSVRDLLPSESYQHFVFAIKREYEALLLRHESAHTKRALETERNRFHALLNSSHDAIAYMHEGMHIEANPAYRKLFGLTEEDIKGLSIIDLISRDARVDFKRALKQVSGNRNVKKTIRCRHLDGQEFETDMEFSSSEMDGEACTRVIIRNQAAGSELQARIKELKDRDPHTGLLNRHTFMHRLDQVLSSGELPEAPVLMTLSIDNFGEISDSAGIVQTDCLLKESSDLLEQQLDSKLLLARFGDHEFIALLSARTPAESLATQCLETLKRTRLEQICEIPVAPRFSAGLVVMESRHEATAHELVRQCIHAGRSARDSSENDVVVFHSAAGQAKDTGPAIDQGIVNLIDHALENDYFLLMYQPVVSLDGDTREDYSVFVRLLDDSDTKHDPEWFFEQARKTERMTEIDRWVVRRTISELANRRARGNKVNFHIQLSREGALDDSMLLWICDCLREFKVKGSWLYFQFEFALLQEKPPELDRFIGSLKKINCRVTCNSVSSDAEDYSAMEHYKVDVARFAPAEMHHLCNDAGRQDRLATLNSRIQDMGIKTVATGIEDANTLALLWNIGVNHIQGYFLQEPSPSIDIDDGADPRPQQHRHLPTKKASN